MAGSAKICYRAHSHIYQNKFYLLFLELAPPVSVERCVASLVCTFSLGERGTKSSSVQLRSPRYETIVLGAI